MNQPNMTEYLKIVPLPSWWQKLDLNELSISQLFEDLLSWNLESKLIAPKNITSTYFGAIMAIFNFSFLVYFLYVIFSLTPEWAPKAGSATCYIKCHFVKWTLMRIYLRLYNYTAYSWCVYNCTVCT